MAAGRQVCTIRGAVVSELCSKLPLVSAMLPMIAAELPQASGAEVSRDTGGAVVRELCTTEGQ